MESILCMTFDDRHFADWLQAIPLFRKYHAHVSFFLAGEVDGEAVAAVKALRAEGHTVGLHTIHHYDLLEFLTTRTPQDWFDQEVAPQLAAMRAAGIPIRAFAYPNNRRTPETDELLVAQGIRHIRVSASQQQRPNALPADQAPAALHLPSDGIGEYYHTVVPQLLARLDAAAQAGQAITFYSHDITPEAHGVHIPTATLEALLARAAALRMRMLGFDEL